MFLPELLWKFSCELNYDRVAHFELVEALQLRKLNCLSKKLVNVASELKREPSDHRTGSHFRFDTSDFLSYSAVSRVNRHILTHDVMPLQMVHAVGVKDHKSNLNSDVIRSHTSTSCPQKTWVEYNSAVDSSKTNMRVHLRDRGLLIAYMS